MINIVVTMARGEVEALLHAAESEITRSRVMVASGKFGPNITKVVEERNEFLELAMERLASGLNKPTTRG